MRGWKLTTPVTLTGRTFWGQKSTLTLSPNREETGWLWDTGDYHVPINADIMVSLKRRVALVAGGHILNEFEHIGILRAAGLEHVIISCSQKWPPYDGGSFALWQAAMHKLVPGPKLKPYLVPWSPGSYHHLECTISPIRSTSFLAFSNAESDRKLDITAVVNYKKIMDEDVRYRFDSSKNPDGLVDLARARTLGWPTSLWGLSKFADMCGWPHHERIAWNHNRNPRELLDEVIRHRVLDMLGILSFLAPPGFYLTGQFHSRMGGHASDVALMKKLHAKKSVHEANVLPFTRATA